MTIYAVIDTNVLVSALLAKHTDSATVQVIERMFDKDFIPLYNDEIISEYNEVLHRPKFPFDESMISWTIQAIIETGLSSARACTQDKPSDPKDIVFYEVAMSRNDSYLVTGNIKHFPSTPRVVTPNELLEILNASHQSDIDE